MNGCKVVRGFLWMMIVPLAVGMGLWAGQAWSQQPSPAFQEGYARGQMEVRDIDARAAEEIKERYARILGVASEAQAKLKAADTEIERLKKLRGATCEPKKEEKK